MAEEVLVPFRPSRETVAPLTAVRSTIIGSSLLSLRHFGHEERYLAALAPEHRETVLYTPAGVWLPTPVALAHYTACDALGLPVHEILEIGGRVALSTQKSVLTGILRLAKEAGVTPWALYTGCDKYWARSFMGSAIGITKLGPKEARFEVAGCALCSSAYWRIGLRGLLSATSEPFATKVYLREVPQLTSGTSCGFRISWA